MAPPPPPASPIPGPDHHEGFDASDVSPADAAVTLRSLRRRYGAVVTTSSSEEEAEAEATDGTGESEDTTEVEDPARRVGSGGTSAADHVAAAAGSIAALDRALAAVLGPGDAEISPDPAEPRGRRPVAGGASTKELLDGLEAVSLRLAERIEAVPAGDWSRTARLEGGGEVSAEGLVRQAVRIGIDELTNARTVTAEVRRRG